MIQASSSSIICANKIYGTWKVGSCLVHFVLCFLHRDDLEVISMNCYRLNFHCALIMQISFWFQPIYENNRPAVITSEKSAFLYIRFRSPFIRCFNKIRNHISCWLRSENVTELSLIKYSFICLIGV